MTLENKSILLIISGGIAAYKSLELIRLIKKSGGQVRCILTKGGSQFVTPLSVAALSEEHVYDDLWSLKDETEMGHIRLSREADLIVIAPASANILAQMAGGLTSDLATTTLLAANKPVLVAPAMNYKMWEHPATQENLATLKERGVLTTGPDEGNMACGEFGMGRMSEPETIFEAINDFFFERPLKGYSALVTSGPTHEPLDPVRFLGNRSSGKQGHAIAAALNAAGANVTLVSGPVNRPDPAGVNVIKVQTAAEMLAACENALPTNIAICAAAVSDFAPENTSKQKIKKSGDNPPAIALKENPDILKTISAHKNRPQLIVGFAAETENLLDNAKTKLSRKGCDWILANDVGLDGKTFGADENHVYLIDANGHEDWGQSSKTEIARKLVNQIEEYFTKNEHIRAAE